MPTVQNVCNSGSLETMTDIVWVFELTGYKMLAHSIISLYCFQHKQIVQNIRIYPLVYHTANCTTRLYQNWTEQENHCKSRRRPGQHWTFFGITPL